MTVKTIMLYEIDQQDQIYIPNLNMSLKTQNWSLWAYDHGDQEHPKYDTLGHSLLMALKGSVIFVISALATRYYFFDLQNYQLREATPFVGVFLLIYLGFMITSRFYESGYPALYQTLWACNQGILLAGIGCLTNDAFLIRTVLVLVSVDQLLWYIDLVGFIVKRKFYVGVAKYIVWPETSKMRLATTFHHIWFLPLCLWVVHPSAKYVSFVPSNYILSCILTLLLAVIGRISTPKQIVIKRPGQEPKTIYMNLNLSWQLWKDLKMGFLTRLYEILPPKALIVMISFIWSIGNIPGYLIFWGIESLSY